MTAIVLKFWPALIPLILVGLWYFFIYDKDKSKEADDATSHFERKLWAFTLLSALVIALIIIVVLLVGQDENKSKTFVPSKIENGKVIPGHFESTD